MVQHAPRLPGLVDLLRERYPDLSPGQRRIADFLVQHDDEAQFLTAAQVAARTGTSESAVVRFAQVLGFSGYPALRRAVHHSFRAHATSAAMMISGRMALAGQPDLIAEVARRDAALIEETARRLDPAALHRCVDRFLVASQVLVVGHRASHALAEYLATTLRQAIGVGTPLSYGTGMAFDVIASAQSNDALVAVSITPYSQPTVDILEAAERQGLFRVAITDHPLGTPARLADEVVLVETEIHPFTSSYAGVMTVFHMLLATISQRDDDRTGAVLAHVDEISEGFRARYQEGEVERRDERGTDPRGHPDRERVDSSVQQEGK